MGLLRSNRGRKPLRFQCSSAPSSDLDLAGRFWRARLFGRAAGRHGPHRGPFAATTTWRGAAGGDGLAGAAGRRGPDDGNDDLRGSRRRLPLPLLLRLYMRHSHRAVRASRTYTGLLGGGEGAQVPHRALHREDQLRDFRLRGADLHAGAASPCGGRALTPPRRYRRRKRPTPCRARRLCGSTG